MPGPNPQRTEKIYSFEGGMTTDADAVSRLWEDIENLLPPAGGGRGEKPREGIDHVIQLTSVASSGCEVFNVTLDDVTRTKLVVLRNASDGQIVMIGEYTEQFGKKPQDAYSGGLDPDDPNGQGTGGGFGEDEAEGSASGAGIMYILGLADNDSLVDPGNPATGIITEIERGTEVYVRLLGLGPEDAEIEASYQILNLTDGTIATEDDVDEPTGTCSVTYDEAAGIMVGHVPLTFEEGEEASFAVFLKNPEDNNVGTIADPSYFEFDLEATPNPEYYPIVARMQDSETCVQFFNPATNQFTGHKFVGYSSPDAIAFCKCGSRHVGVLTRVGSTISMAIYSVSAIISQGGYFAGASATHSPIAEVSLGTASSFGLVKIFAYPEGKSFAVVNGTLYRINLSAGTVSTIGALSGLGGYTGYSTGFFETHGSVSTDGYLILPVKSGSNYKIAKIHPGTGAATYLSAATTNVWTAATAMPSGEVYVPYDSGTVTHYKYSSDLQTLTALGTTTSAEVDDGMTVSTNGIVPIKDDAVSFVIRMVDVVPFSSTLTAITTGNWYAGHSWFGNVLLWLYVSGTDLQLRRMTEAGVVSATINVVDRYGGVSGNFADITHGTVSPSHDLIPDATAYSVTGHNATSLI